MNVNNSQQVRVNSVVIPGLSESVTPNKPARRQMSTSFEFARCVLPRPPQIYPSIGASNFSQMHPIIQQMLERLLRLFFNFVQPPRSEGQEGSTQIFLEGQRKRVDS